ncbi:MAG TPA: membrane dipeptidase [Oscillospiraceae bacterium]|nr:membrane dipeptidase [Oscillospiraceae bacterium]HPF55061.1 membrane dipeptidase [Clostridiales bacterium]HPK34878.1 membrane dipeptidase [Oscillospiraceae bacterium]HPR76158.1 membrane dipeptidase [Oscillospiraceae bacterium]
MNLFDLHCDTATAAFDAGKPFSAFSLPFLKSPYESWVQTFAICIDPTEKEEARAYFGNVSDYLLKELPRYPAVTPVLAVENCGNIIQNPDEDIAMLKALGFRIVSLTHNPDNPLCGGIKGDGRGLSPLGKEVISALVLNGITLDCSHCSDKAFWDICEATDETFIATHSDSRTVCGETRNLTDEQAKEIFRRGGLVGLNFYEAFLGDGGSVRALITHIERFFALGGEKCLAIGSDYDGAQIAKELFDLKKVEKRIAKVFGQSAADDIFYNNAARFFG